MLKGPFEKWDDVRVIGGYCIITFLLGKYYARTEKYMKQIPAYQIVTKQIPL